MTRLVLKESVIPTLRPTRTIRGALIAGFGAVLGVWAFAGYELIRSIQDVERQVKAAHESFTHDSDIRGIIRSNVLLGSLTVRDVLITNTPGSSRESYRDVLRAELRELRNEVDRRLPEGLARVQPSERGQWERLQSQLDQYWKSLEFVFEPLPFDTFDAASILRREVLPARENVLQILDELRALQRLSQAEHDVKVATLYNDVRSRFMWVVAGALALGLGVAWFAFWHVGTLERELLEQRTAEMQTRHELERLSARLVNAQEEERRNLARELHDEVGQALTAIKMDVGIALRSPATDARSRSSLEEARSLAETTLQSVRDMSQLLHPSVLDDFGLPETLAAYLRSFTKRTGIRAQLNHEGLGERLPTDVEVCIYRIVQEALTNVARHSGALSCTVRVVRSSTEVELTIEDTGHGITMVTDTTPDTRRGLGMIAMRERAQALSGRFAIESRPGGGTRISVTLPVPPSQPVEQRVAV